METIITHVDTSDKGTREGNIMLTIPPLPSTIQLMTFHYSQEIALAGWICEAYE